MTPYVYHFKPQGMFGDRLFPLNRLKDQHPAVYEEHVKKYKGRERLLSREIPLLNCLWNDVLHISPIHPQLVMNTWRAEGLYPATRPAVQIEVYKIPVDLLIEDTTACYQSFNFDYENYQPENEKFWAFKKSDYAEQTEVSAKQIEIWKSDTAKGRRLFWYSHTMHVLAMQEIDVANCELITCT